MENDSKAPGADHWRRLDVFLRTDPSGPGCDAVRERLDVFAELSVQGRTLSSLLPAVGAHLDACDGCSEDLAGLVVALLDGRPGHVVD